jgi:hypothetical protein
MKLILETRPYNEKRYGKPYIAKCDEKAKVIEWGEWLGDKGMSGELSIDVEPGDLIMQGQKDHRKPRNSAPGYGLFVDLDTEIQWTDKMTAIRAQREFLANVAEH